MIPDLNSQIKTSVNTVRAQVKHVQVSEDEVKSFGACLQPDDLLEIKSLVKLPLQFDNDLDEINFYATMHLLNFGSGFIPELEAAGKKYFESIQFGLLALHLSQTKLSTEFYLNAKIFDISETFEIPARVEQQVASAITAEVPGPLHPYVTLIVKTLNDTGLELQKMGCQSLGHFIVDVLKPSSGSEGPRAAALMEALAKAFVAFRERATVGDTQVDFYTKALALVDALYQRFHDSDPTRFNFVDVEWLPASCNPNVVSVLGALGLMKVQPLGEGETSIGGASVTLSEGKGASDGADGPTVTVEGNASAQTVVELRAIAMSVCEEIAAAMSAASSWTVSGRMVALYLTTVPMDKMRYVTDKKGTPGQPVKLCCKDSVHF
eukprot:GFYU01001385.1.p1 GENE.GFYU01001385.1~~GFYU01001385.1.p1  ORF type:complete len:379 (-),score=66.47 GFYU01001385.1:202-1338(-)